MFCVMRAVRRLLNVNQCDVSWQMSLGITFWNMVDLLAYGTMAGLVYVFVWKALLDYLDLNKESIRR